MALFRVSAGKSTGAGITAPKFAQYNVEYNVCNASIEIQAGMIQPNLETVCTYESALQAQAEKRSSVEKQVARF